MLKFLKIQIIGHVMHLRLREFLIENPIFYLWFNTFKLKNSSCFCDFLNELRVVGGLFRLRKLNKPTDYRWHHNRNVINCYFRLIITISVGENYHLRLKTMWIFNLKVLIILYSKQAMIFFNCKFKSSNIG